MIKIMNVLVLISIIFELYMIIRCVFKYIMKLRFKKIYNICYLDGITIKKNINRVEKNNYTLSFPHWLYSKKDGTADKRRNGNCIVWLDNVLFIDDKIVSSKNPLRLVEVVEDLRGNGIKIEKSKEELEKIKDIKNLEHNQIQFDNVQVIIDRFRENPTEFENFVASIYEKMGYKTQITSKTNDGGYDIELRKDYTKIIVECKCYAQKNKISRPLIQKLVGVNQKEQADEIIFLTTSDFSKEAEEYAKQMDVKLVNGKELLKMIELYEKFVNINCREDSYSCGLNEEDLEQYMPMDMKGILSLKRYKDWNPVFWLIQILILCIFLLWGVYVYSETSIGKGFNVNSYNQSIIDETILQFKNNIKK